MDKDIRKYIQELLRKIVTVNETPEVMPAPQVKPVQPDVQPAPTPLKRPVPTPAPRRILKPNIHPGADPAPKAKLNKPEPGYKKKTEVGKLYETAYYLEKLRYTSLINESPINANSGNINPNIKKAIDTGQDHPYKNIDILHKQDDQGKKTIQRLGDEEFQDVKQSATNNNVNSGARSLIHQFKDLLSIEQKNKRYLESLAKNTVKTFFGVPDDVMDNIVAILKRPGEIDGRGMDDDGMDDMTSQELMSQFTPEEQQTIKQHVDKRIISNALIMGAGFKAHNLLDKIKPQIDHLSPNLFPIYKQIMAGAAMEFWQMTPSSDMKVNKEDGEAIRALGGAPTNANTFLGGKAELIMGEDENGDGIRAVEGAKAEAIIFPVLLHEVVKAVLEYIFANGLPQFNQEMNSAIMKQSEALHFEHWHKLLGPRLWKYLHDAIDYIVHDREADYTIVAFLLQEISMLPPKKFLALMDLILHNGGRAIEVLTKMLDGIENSSAEDNSEEVPTADFSNLESIMSQVQSLLNQPVDNSSILNHKPFEQMSDQELSQFNALALEHGEYDIAAEARDEMEKRGLV